MSPGKCSLGFEHTYEQLWHHCCLRLVAGDTITPLIETTFCVKCLKKIALDMRTQKMSKWARRLSGDLNCLAIVTERLRRGGSEIRRRLVDQQLRRIFALIFSSRISIEVCYQYEVDPDVESKNPLEYKKLCKKMRKELGCIDPSLRKMRLARLVAVRHSEKSENTLLEIFKNIMYLRRLDDIYLKRGGDLRKSLQVSFHPPKETCCVSKISGFEVFSSRTCRTQ